MARQSLERSILESIVKHYIESGDFNGTPMRVFVRSTKRKTKSLETIKELVRRGDISLAFASQSINPHIRRLPDLPIEEQLYLLNSEPIDGICCYPNRTVIERGVDLSVYSDRPFTKALLLGAPQLGMRAFDLSVLERYFNDPRFHVTVHDFGGAISISSEADADSDVPDRDKTFLETFGLGYTDSRRRLAVSFLRYLSNLTPDHQQHWHTYRHEGNFKITKDFYNASFVGDWPENISYLSAILAEMRIINNILVKVVGIPLFRKLYDEERPKSLSFFLRPTLRNFNEFVISMDKILSENLNKKFFAGIDPETEERRSDGKIIVRTKGTLQLLEEWIRKTLRFKQPDEAIEKIVGPMKKVRRLRQNPAHKLEEDVYDISYEEQQKEILDEVSFGLSNLRIVLETHPKAPPPCDDEFLNERKLSFY
ncbi:hypothetical protein KXS07_23815 [Inquilinus limosus]|uniref:hypothetical protein n=1 Tax=Inquilinus limosus TaxID=171674 RepID=UPI003F187B7F